MLMSLRNMVIQLAEGKPSAFRNARQMYLECVEGVLWLTIEGQPGDFLLIRGERVRIESDGLALAQGLPSATVRLTSSEIRLMRRMNNFRLDFLSLLPRFIL